VPVSLEDYIANWLDGRKLLNNMLMLFRLGAVCWALWKARNKVAIEKKIMKSPQEVLYNVIFFM
jgi:hypothetical protein